MRAPSRGVPVVLSLAMAGSAVAQMMASDPPVTPATAPALSPWTRWGTDISLLFDGYVDRNFSSPPSGYNAFRNFDLRADTAHLGMSMVMLDRAPAPIGFHVDAGLGQMFDAIHCTDRAPRQLDHIKQAYVSIKPKLWRGVEVDAGEFVTSAGAEVIETNQNWNYSRSLLFAWAIPYYHFGIRTSFPMGSHFTGGVQLVNGWNNILNNNDNGKTLGLTGAYAGKWVTLTNTYLTGPVKCYTARGWRQLYDMTAHFSAGKNAIYYLNLDYGRDRTTSVRQWAGIAAAGRWSLSRKYAIAARTEWFDDANGYTTATAQTLKEVTVTGEYQISSWLTGRLEFRNDWSNQASFHSGNGPSKSQPTALFGVIAFFGPKK